MTTHLCIDIAGFLKKLERGDRMARDLFSPAPITQVVRELGAALDEGKTYYTGCDRMDATGRCSGHPDNETD